MKITAISDTHGFHDKLVLSGGDILIHCGDFSMRGRPEELVSFNKWLGEQEHKHKLLVYGNHDFLGQNNPMLAKELLSNATILTDEEVTIDGIRFYGSPWTPQFYDWAFMKPHGEMHTVWERIPAGIDVLITHGPPKDILDKTHNGMNVGCNALAFELGRVRPRLHFFGHIHESYGMTSKVYEKNDSSSDKHNSVGTVFLNVSTCDRKYRPVNKVITWSI